MVSLNESMASRLYQWARDLKLVETSGSWKGLPHQTKERWRSLARNLHNYLGAEAYPEGDFIVVPPGEYKVRPYTRPYTKEDQGDGDREVGTTVSQGQPAQGQGPAEPDPGGHGVPEGTQAQQGSGQAQGTW